MFSGIISCVAEVNRCTYTSSHRGRILSGFSVTLGDDHFYEGLVSGASCAVNGVCLTLTEDSDDLDLWFDLSTSTSILTTLSQLQKDSKVHFERALKLGDENGGHILSGHVDGTAKLISRTEGDLQDMILGFEVSSDVAQYMVNGGYVACDGCSLTIRDLVYEHEGSNTEKAHSSTSAFSVNLIGETIRRTLFSNLDLSAQVNIEVDTQTKVIVQAVSRGMKHVRMNLMM